MKKKYLFIFITFACLFLFSCDDGDSANSLPNVETEKFKTETGFDFPINTSALEIYKTLSEYYGEEKTISVNGTYSHTETATLNGQLYTDTKTKNISSIKIYKTNTEISHSFHTDFIFDDDSSLEFYYQWQYHNDNVWHNNKSDGIITLTNS